MVAGPPVQLAPVTPAVGTWSGPCAIDPFSVPLEDKLAMLVAADEALRAEPAVTITTAQCGAYRERKWFGSTEGAFIEQSWVETGAGIVAYAVKDGEVVSRSYPDSHGGGWAQAGWEYVTGLDLVSEAARVAEQAAALLGAPECANATVDLIIDASQMALQVHESIGHPTELDRVLGEEAAFAGTSWVGLGRRRLARVRLPSRDRDRRRHRRGVSRQLRVGRRGSARAARLHRARRPAHRAALVSGDRSGAGPHEQRLHARRRMEPRPARAHDHRLARARHVGASTT